MTTITIVDDWGVLDPSRDSRYVFQVDDFGGYCSYLKKPLRHRDIWSITSIPDEFLRATSRKIAEDWLNEHYREIPFKNITIVELL